VDPAAGPDRIGPRLLKELASGLAVIFSKTMSKGELKDNWREDNMMPIFKKWAKSSIGNYRLITYLRMLQGDGSLT
jgi:hypothetical protein